MYRKYWGRRSGRACGAQRSGRTRVGQLEIDIAKRFLCLGALRDLP
jgi:hypothetical protein